MTQSLSICIALCLTFITLNPNTARAQCDNFPQSFEEAIKDAPVIVEGRHLPKTAVRFGGEFNSDYISFKVLVYKVLKGNFKADTIEIVNPDGSWRQAPIHGNVIGEEYIGLMFLYPSEETQTPLKDIPANLKFQSKFLSECPFISYNRSTWKKTENPLIDKLDGSYYGINSDKELKRIIYDPIKKVAGYSYKECRELEKKNCFFLNPTLKNAANGLAKNSQAMPTISSFSPTNITAGI